MDVDDRRREVRVRRGPASIVVLLLLAAAVTGLGGDARAVPWDNGLARTPPMGFDNWNATQCGPGFTAAAVESAADALRSTGLAAAGYRYVDLDDCWALPNRDAAGNLVPDPARFPQGIRAVADYVHARGLQFGIYSSAGTRTCDAAGFPGSLGHEGADARQFAAWGVDYLKYDNCANDSVDARERYTAMRDALAATHRPIVYAICEWGQSRPWEWAAVVGNSWRTTADITDSWPSLLANFTGDVDRGAAAGPGHWNDPDLLEVGNGGMTPTEYRSQFSLWAMLAAPLLISTDLGHATPDTLRTLANPAIIALDQDPLGRQADRLPSSAGTHVLVKPLVGGDRAVALFNATDRTATVGTTLAALGLSGPHQAHDLWTGTTTTTTDRLTADVPAHATVVLRITG